jgi:ESS family glutamate:Na+ symporter
MDIVTSFSGLCLLLVVGKYLRFKIKLLQRLYIPTSVIGGLLGLFILQTMGWDGLSSRDS